MRLALALLVVALLVPAVAGASELKPTSAELESELVCPICETTLDSSDAPAARRIKAFIRARIAAGDTKSEIKDKLVADFGPAVLAVPPRKGFDWIAWLLPLGGLAVGFTAVGALAWRWSRRDRDDPPPSEQPLDPAVARRLDDELARFE
jgi:cytochrome c-type biogenesis protein CcmH